MVFSVISPSEAVLGSGTVSRGVRALGIVAVLIVAGSTSGAVAAAQPTPSGPAFVVDLNRDGSATVSIRFTFDLETETEREAFDSLAADAQERTDIVSDFRSRMGSVAFTAANATGRPMTITGASMELVKTGDRTGVISLNVSWDGLAGRMGDQLVLTEPFTSGYAPDRRLLVLAPDGYAIAIAHPEPVARDQATASWSVGPRLDGFLVVAGPDVAPTPPARTSSRRTATTDGQPGFAITAALSGIGGIIAWALRRRFGEDRSRPDGSPPNRNR